MSKCYFIGSEVKEELHYTRGFFKHQFDVQMLPIFPPSFSTLSSLLVCNSAVYFQ